MKDKTTAKPPREAKTSAPAAKRPQYDEYDRLAEAAGADAFVDGRPPVLDYESNMKKGREEFDPFTGERWVAEEHPVLKMEATHDQTMEIVRALDAGRVIMTHLEEPFWMSFDDYERLSEKLRGEGYPIEFAYDTMTVEA